MDWPIRPAHERDIPALEELIALSVRTLLAPHYAPAVLAASLGPAFGVDAQLIRDGTYFVVEDAGQIVACGGWSRRRTAYGGDRDRASEEDPPLDSARDPARIRAFFVHPRWARCGLGRSLLVASEDAARAAGFSTAMLVATLAGEKLYAAFGYTAVERYDSPLPGGLPLPVVRMTKTLTHSPA
jgi:GNAT superfamily N-acetyltransferase